MSTASKGLASFRLSPETEGTCSVAVIYEDTPARERAVWLSHHLIREFWAEIDFEFSWWRFKYLRDPEIAVAAVAAAARADVIVFSVHGSTEPPTEVQDWIAQWIEQKGDRPSVLVPLIEPATDIMIATSPIFSWLQEVARRAGIECLLPSQLQESLAISESARNLHNRATQVTHVLDEILHNYGGPPSPPSHWGLNE